MALYNTDSTNPNPGARPITSRPNVAAFPKGGYIVVFGTGSYLSTADANSAGRQAFYGIWDKPATTGMVTDADLVQQTVVATGNGSDGVLYRLTTHAVDNPTDSVTTGDAALSLSTYYASKRGWYLNLPTSGERSVTDSRVSRRSGNLHHAHSQCQRPVQVRWQRLADGARCLHR